MLLHVNVITRAPVPSVLARTPDHFTVKVTAPPEKGKANEEVCRLLADHFAVPRSAVRIIRGLTTRKKIVEIIQ
ncbi:DUF167 domain-containing protein [candidate division WOR-3 bacterium]|nr:DUF167 domain-containing protein [candidate division WOR-3 bacterium]